jgi:LysR family glycine cleavage system transcriptional activator
MADFRTALAGRALPLRGSGSSARLDQIEDIGVLLEKEDRTKIHIIERCLPEKIPYAIRFGQAALPWPDCRLSGPKLFAERNRITKAADLLKFPLLRLEGAKNWTCLFEAAGVNATVGPGPVLNRASMLIDAATDGQGIALTRTALAAWDLVNGRLPRPVDVSLRMASTYWFVP